MTEPRTPNARDQTVIDAEMSATRQLLLAAFRDRLRADPGTLTTAEFLALADWQIVRTAVVIAAGEFADGCALHARDPWSGVMRLVRHRGLSGPFVDVLARVGDLSPCVAVLSTGDTVKVDDLTAGPGFPGRDALLADAFRVMHCHPLYDEGGALLGTLVLYFRDAGPHPGGRRLARAAGLAMARVQAPAPPHRPSLS